MAPLYAFCKLNVFGQDGNVSAEYTFGTAEGARAWLAAHDCPYGWSLMSLVAYPCDESDPSGQLYFGVVESEFHD